jgi:hypothetical protein
MLALDRAIGRGQAIFDEVNGWRAARPFGPIVPLRCLKSKVCIGRDTWAAGAGVFALEHLLFVVSFASVTLCRG